MGLNERITEDIVREHLKRDNLFCDIVLEEQKSAKPKINKLLSGASKSGAGDIGKEKHVKHHQLYGIEYQPEIYPLAVSNMFLHGDGKSNIFFGDCFDTNLIKEIKAKKPNVGFLNPPYKSEKKDTEELRFILNNLECLNKHGLCVAIVPMSCVLSATGERLRLKEKLLENHTLKAVLSMPPELFNNSKVSTNTCVIVIEAHIKHPETKETFFGYFRDDGFYKKKTRGRFDYDKKWDAIKAEWLYSSTNNKEKAGFSVTRKVKASDEWCAEAYIDTDYKTLNKKIFEKSVKSLVSYYFGAGFIDEIKQNPFTDCASPVNLSPEEWVFFDLRDIFVIEGSKSHTKTQIMGYGKGFYPYVVTSSENNGVQGLYEHKTENGNVLTVDSATVGSCFYQEFDFSASDHVEKLIPRFEMNVFTPLFLKTIIDLEKFRYGYGRKFAQIRPPKHANTAPCGYGYGRKFAQIRLKRTKIKLPIGEKGSPDWEFMEGYIKSLPYSSNLEKTK